MLYDGWWLYDETLLDEANEDVEIIIIKRETVFTIVTSRVSMSAAMPMVLIIKRLRCGRTVDDF